MIWTLSLLFSLVAAAGFKGQQERQIEGPSADQVRVSNFTTAGNGCSQGTVGLTLSSDRTVLTFGFDGYTAHIGPSTSIKDRSKSCELNVNLTYPTEFQYSVTKTTYHGYAVLDRGLIGVMQAVYSFSSPLENATTIAKVPGSVIDVFTINVYVAETTRIWSPCGVNIPLLMRTRISLTSSISGTGTYVFPGTMEDDSPGVHTWQTGISWRRCPV
ncbi:hypothetical protein VTL71DRAFT_14112 [Oculimacula yallundae]|uniref:Secreted protein n=1 Tax=Oculimacula yallundae TaxID=86028 RepID=A0ABR4CHN9_9HELO